MNNATTDSPLDAFLRPRLGLPAWGVVQGHGSFLTFEFGQPTLEISERHSAERGLIRSAFVHGEWRLWIYCCHWRAFQGGAQLAWSEDGSASIARAAAQLNGPKLLAVNVEPSTGRSTFTFDLGGSLETWPYGADRTDEQWIILTEDETFAYRADGFCSRGPKATLPAQQQWLPIQ